MHHVQICTPCKIGVASSHVTETAGRELPGRDTPTGDTTGRDTPTGDTAERETARRDAPGRRELNKARTREALVDALREQALQRPVDQITVEQLAESAGISRRTFFNYYPSILALVSEIIGTHTEHLADAIGDLGGDVPPVESLRRLVREVGIPTELLDWLAILSHYRVADTSDAHLALERSIWAEKGAWLERELTARLPDGVDELYVATLAGAVMNAFAAAEQVWIAGRTPGAPVDAASVATFNDLLDRALGHASTGWAALPRPAPAA